MNENMEVFSNINYEPNKILRFLRKLKWLFNIYLPGEHDAVLATKNGYLKFNSKDKTTGRILAVYRNHEYTEMKDVVKFLEDQGVLSGDSDIVVDVGGYIGMSSTGFLLSGWFSQALSFEPSPENFRLLKENIKLNKLEDKLLAYNIALSDKEDTLEFELSKKNYGDNRVRKISGKGSFGEDNRDVIKVEADTFDHFLEVHPEIAQEKVKLIWMDIQGHEGLFLKGARNFIKQHPKVPTAMEFWPYGIERSGIKKDEILQLIVSLYTHFYILGKFDKSYSTLELEKFYDSNMSGGDGLNILLINL